MADTRSSVINFLWGFGIGAGVALLFAPQSGGENRRFVKEKINEGKQYAQDTANEIQRQAMDLVDRSEQIVSREVDRIYSAIDAGRSAYREAKVNGSVAS